jgi:outer membrane protein
MRRVFFAIFAMMMCMGVASAQNYMVVDSEKVFKSLDAYNSALEQIETLSAQYQQSVDARFKEVENMYNTYIQQRASLSDGLRQQREQAILDKVDYYVEKFPDEHESENAEEIKAWIKKKFEIE